MGKILMKRIVCETLLSLPPEKIKFVTKNVWFISSPEDSWAFTFRGSEISNQYLVILSDELFKQNIYQIRFTILHEIGHAILSHKNSMGHTQSKSEIKQQEYEADQFAKKYIPDFPISSDCN
jgi:hypothetical protein